MAAENGSELSHGNPDAHGELDPHHSIEPHEKPEDWGWHHEFTTGRQIGGWFCVLVLGLYLTGWHYNRAGTLAIVIVMVLLVGGLLLDRQRRRTQWRQ